jgi:DNA-binding MarR family transcriptional regulator
MKHGTKPGEVVDMLARECLGVRLRMIHRAVNGIYDNALRPHGLRAGQMTILIGVAYAGSIKPGRLCRVMRMEKSTLSRDVEVLARKGWLAVEPDTEKRGQTLRLSSSGATLLKTVVPAWEQAQREVAELLGEAGVEAVHATARKLGFPICRS